mmetsp:Transcript_62178/g.196237  ORF Transcript_62178/g.196237 Transcript_62178/m.196237 type:complete len:213 (-) Transcript_62178:1286-1924(-)
MRGTRSAPTSAAKCQAPAARSPQLDRRRHGSSSPPASRAEFCQASRPSRASLRGSCARMHTGGRAHSEAHAHTLNTPERADVLTETGTRSVKQTRAKHGQRRLLRSSPPTPELGPATLRCPASRPGCGARRSRRPCSPGRWRGGHRWASWASSTRGPRDSPAAADAASRLHRSPGNCPAPDDGAPAGALPAAPPAAPAPSRSRRRATSSCRD